MIQCAQFLITEFQNETLYTGTKILVGEIVIKIENL